jgi:hypothetical protein
MVMRKGAGLRLDAGHASMLAAVMENERAYSNAPHNNEMQRTKHGPTGASPLISVFSEPKP